MGTSTSHPSPPTINWHAVWAGYTDPHVPLERIVAEVWRAISRQAEPIENFLASPLLFRCHQLVRQSPNLPHALQTVTRTLAKSKTNTIISELGRRCVAPAFDFPEPVRAWRGLLFEHVTDYLVSRDISGYVGESFRNRNVRDVVHFKESALTRIRDIVAGIPGDPDSPREWRTYVRRALSALTGEE